MAPPVKQQDWHVPIPAPQDEASINGTLADSFPASDPPSWTPGVSRPPPQRIADVSGRAPRRARQEMVEWIEAAALVLVIVFVTLLILGMPPRLLVRLLGDAVARMVSSLR